MHSMTTGLGCQKGSGVLDFQPMSESVVPVEMARTPGVTGVQLQ